MNRMQSFKIATLAALAAVAVVPVIACGGSDPNPNTANQQAMNNGQQFPQQQQQFPQQQQQFPQQQQQFPQQQQQPFPQQQPQQFPQQQPPPQQFPQQQPQPTTGTAPAPSGSATAAGLPGFPIDPNLLAQIMGGSQAALGQAGVPGDLTEAGIKIAAQQFAPGMQAEGPMIKDSLQADGHKEAMITLAGGKCYTVIGFSPLGQIKNLDLHLLAPPFYNVSAGQDDSTSNTAVVGKGNQPLCPITPFPLQYKLDLHARSGAGQVGAQLFSKNR